MVIVDKKTGKVLGKEIKVAKTLWTRTKGLMFIKEMNGMDGLLIENCNSIHNCFVRFPIDAIFLNRDMKIVKILRNFKPWRFSWIYFGATRVLELPAGAVPEDITKGDVLEVQYV